MEQTHRANQVLISAPRLHMHLLGDFRLVYADTLVSEIRSPRLQALLAYLVLHRDTPQPRQYLAFQMWPDSSEAQARTNLRQLVHSLKQTLPEAGEFLYTDAQTLQWQPEAPFWLDVAEFEQAIAQAATAEQQRDPYAMRAALEQAVNIYHGDLLPSCYDDWILPERERLRQSVTRALERLMLLLESQGDLRAAIAYAQRLLHYDPLREETYQALMRLHSACGDRAAVARVYHTCSTVLERELEVEPSAATRQAYEQLLKVDAQVRPVTPSQPKRTNLPVPLTSLVGREAEMAEMTHLLQTTRLLTLTGPGGCGKTRLALEAAINRLDQYPDGVWWVELAGLSDAELVPQSVATALGVRDLSGRPLLETLVDYLRSKQSLLLLDNCEHLVEACARLAEQCLSACPHLQILATSREALSVGGETTWLVPSLSLPEAQPPSIVEELMRYEAIRLFVERAATVLPTFRLTAANAPLVAQICRHLDGIPLAIELAAGRVKVLTAEQIGARLDDVFHLLTAGRRTVLLRHQTLRAAMDWSYDLLSDRERVLFRRLSAFAGGFTLAAAEAVCAGDGLEAGEVLDLLSHLVDKSLVAVTQDGETRYRLLETIRQYAYEKLQEAGEVEAVRWQHINLYLSLAEAAELRLTSAERDMWLAHLEVEHDNLRSALGWLLEQGEIETALRLAGALYWFWRFQGNFSEGRRWLEAAIALDNKGQALDIGLQPSLPRLRAKVLFGAGALAVLQGDHERSRFRLEESVALWREHGDQRGLAYALDILAHALMYSDPLAAYAYAEESVALMRAVGNTWDLAWALHFQGSFAINLGDAGRAQALQEESLTLFRETGDKWAIGLPLTGLGFVSFLLGDLVAAVSWFEQAVSMERDQPDPWLTAFALNYLGHMVRLQGDNRRALGLYRESIRLNGKVGDRRGIAASVVGIALVAASQGQFYQAARLFAATEAPLEAQQASMATIARMEWNRALTQIRAQLDPDQSTAAWAEGREMTLEDAVTDASSVTAKG